MSLCFMNNGNLKPGIHQLSWKEFTKEYGYNVHRQTLLSGLKMACTILRKHGCRDVYIDGSFVAQTELPNDYDGCWDPTGVDIGGLIKEQPLFMNLTPPRLGQKAAFKGELFLTTTLAGPPGKTMLDFFQLDRNLTPKGIIKIDLNTII